MNQADGFDCPGCAWPDPAEPGERSSFEFCENGAKAVAWEATKKRCDPAFFAKHTVRELDRWSDHELEAVGRLTRPMRYDPRTDRYTEATWDEAYRLVGERLRGLDDPDHAVFYTSGRTSNEAAFLYQLLGRRLGTNNFPDCSNMCHESSGVAMAASIGVGKGTVTLEDFALADQIWVIGQNPGTNHPRMLTELERACRRGCSIVSVNPMRERAMEGFVHPQDARAMVLNEATPIASELVQPVIGGDLALFTGICKRVLDIDEAAGGGVVDRAFVEAHTVGFDAFAKAVRAEPWAALGERAGVSVNQIRDLARSYCDREPGDRVLGDGADPAARRRRNDPDGAEPPAAPRQPRQARRRRLPGPRALQRAGRPDDGHHRAAPGGAARGHRAALRLPPSDRARPRRRRLDPRDGAGRGGRLRRSRRQLRLRHARHRPAPPPRCGASA